MKVYRAFQDKRKILEVAGKKVRPRNRKERSEQELTVRPIRVQVTPTSTRRSRRRWSFFVSSKASFGSFLRLRIFFFLSWRVLDFLAAIRADRSLDGLIHASSDQSNEMGSDRIGSVGLIIFNLDSHLDQSRIRTAIVFTFRVELHERTLIEVWSLVRIPAERLLFICQGFTWTLSDEEAGYEKSFLRLIVSFISFLFLARNHWNPSAFNNNRHGSLKRLGSTEMPTNSPRSHTHSHTHTRTFTL